MTLLSPFKSLWSRVARPAPEPVALLPLAITQAPLYVIGDVHGCLAELEALCETIKQDAAQFAERPKLLLLGDFIDRGVESAGVLDFLLSRKAWADCLCIRGNHEEMMLDFLAAPQRNGAWLDFGGFETLRSYGLALDQTDLRQMSERRALQILQAHIPQEHIQFLKNLPYGYHAEIGGETWVFAHAGFNPSLPLSNQAVKDLIWAPQFATHRDQAKSRLVFGHIIQDEINLNQKWIGIDSGAYKTGRLTALRLTMDGQIIELHYKTNI